MTGSAPQPFHGERARPELTSNLPINARQRRLRPEREPDVTPTFDPKSWMATMPTLDLGALDAAGWLGVWLRSGSKKVGLHKVASSDFHGELGALPRPASPLHHDLNVPVERVQEP